MRMKTPGNARRFHLFLLRACAADGAPGSAPRRSRTELPYTPWFRRTPAPARSAPRQCLARATGWARRCGRCRASACPDPYRPDRRGGRRPRPRTGDRPGRDGWTALRSFHLLIGYLEQHPYLIDLFLAEKHLGRTAAHLDTQKYPAILHLVQHTLIIGAVIGNE